MKLVFIHLLLIVVDNQHVGRRVGAELKRLLKVHSLRSR